MKYNLFLTHTHSHTEYWREITEGILVFRSVIERAGAPIIALTLYLFPFRSSLSFICWQRNL